MEPRARRLAIREHLNQARAALDAGDRASALAAVNAALDIDPEYLAAQALKDRIERSTPATWPASRKPDPFRVETRQDAADVSSDRRPTLPVEPPMVSAEGWARFEHRAKTRRLEHRVAAARVAIQKRRFAEARSILQEIEEIDSGHPDLISLGMEFDAEQHLAPTPRRPWGPAIAAMLIVAAVIFGARYLQSPEWTSAVPVVQTASAVPADNGTAAIAPSAADSAPAPSEPAALPNPGSVPAVDQGVDTDRLPAPAESPTQAIPAPPPMSRSAAPATGAVDNPPANPDSQARDAAVEPARETILPAATSGRIVWPPIQQAVAVPPAAPVPAPPSASPAASVTAFTPPAPSLAPAVTAASLPGPVVAEPSDAVASRIVPRDPDADRARSAAAAVMNVPRDEDLVRRTLQQYRAAYENLDARSAHAVWPAVSESALQRAFSELESQQLNFDTCDVQVRGITGLATCRGTMLYVPKIGSHDPRREPRVWTFDLRKVGENWQIDSARIAR